MTFLQEVFYLLLAIVCESSLGYPVVPDTPHDDEPTFIKIQYLILYVEEHLDDHLSLISYSLKLSEKYNPILQNSVRCATAAFITGLDEHFIFIT